jgi:hypothetical protein
MFFADLLILIPKVNDPVAVLALLLSVLTACAGVYNFIRNRSLERRLLYEPWVRKIWPAFESSLSAHINAAEALASDVKSCRRPNRGVEPATVGPSASAACPTLDAPSKLFDPSFGRLLERHRQTICRMDAKVHTYNLLAYPATDHMETRHYLKRLMPSEDNTTELEAEEAYRALFQKYLGVKDGYSVMELRSDEQYYYDLTLAWTGMNSAARCAERRIAEIKQRSELLSARLIPSLS